MTVIPYFSLFVVIVCWLLNDSYTVFPIVCCCCCCWLLNDSVSNMQYFTVGSA